MKTKPGHIGIVEALIASGVRRVIGIPGTQNIHFFEGLRRSGLEVVVPTSELNGAFMAGAIFRTSRELCLLATIPGPGFLFALPGIAEAKADSAALVHVITFDESDADKQFRLQELPIDRISEGLYKDQFQIDSADDFKEMCARAATTALSGEPGPVLLKVSTAALSASVYFHSAALLVETENFSPLLQSACERLRSARRPVLLVGEGAFHCSEQLSELVKRFRIPLCTTPSARGLVSESNEFVIPIDFGCGGVSVFNTIVSEADLVIGIGCKLGHNGSGGFALRIPPDKFVRVDASPEVLAANYPASLGILGDAQQAISSLLSIDRPVTEWSADWFSEKRKVALESRLASVLFLPLLENRSALAFFQEVLNCLRSESIIVTDTGFHQQLVRALISFDQSRLIAPMDFQSMGFGIPAAIGAALANPSKNILAIVGDGGLACSGLELRTATHLKLNIQVLVFVDGSYGLIRRQQLSNYGHEFAVELPRIDLRAFAESIGATYLRYTDNSPDEALGSNSRGVKIVEVSVQEPPELFQRARKTRRRNRIIQHSGARRIKSFLVRAAAMMRRVGRKT